MLQEKDMDNIQIASLLRDIAACYQIANEDKNKFRIIAYERAADAVEHLSSEAKDLRSQPIYRIFLKLVSLNILKHY